MGETEIRLKIFMEGPDLHILAEDNGKRVSGKDQKDLLMNSATGRPYRTLEYQKKTGTDVIRGR